MARLATVSESSYFTWAYSCSAEKKERTSWMRGPKIGQWLMLMLIPPLPGVPAKPRGSLSRNANRASRIRAALSAGFACPCDVDSTAAEVRLRCRSTPARAGTFSLLHGRTAHIIKCMHSCKIGLHVRSLYQFIWNAGHCLRHTPVKHPRVTPLLEFQQHVDLMV